MSNTKNLKGSPYRDAVKQWHKTLPSDLYVCDIDLALISFEWPEIRAILDVKSSGDKELSNTHKQLYNWFLLHDILVFLITIEPYEKVHCQHCGRYEVVIADDAKVSITEYSNGNVVLMTKSEYIEWERGWRE